MFKYTVMALVASASAHRLHHHSHHTHDLVGVQSQGIAGSELMDGAHWRKAWPEGIDDATGDDQIMNIGNALRRTESPPVKRVTYPFELEDDIKDSQRHLKEVEATGGQEFGETDKSAYLDRGYNILNAGGPVKMKSIYL